MRLVSPISRYYHPVAVIRFHPSLRSPNFALFSTHSTSVSLNTHADRMMIYQNRLDNKVQPRSWELGQNDMLGYRPLRSCAKMPYIALSRSDCIADAADCIHIIAARCNHWNDCYKGLAQVLKYKVCQPTRQTLTTI